MLPQLLLLRRQGYGRCSARGRGAVERALRLGQGGGNLRPAQPGHDLPGRNPLAGETIKPGDNPGLRGHHRDRPARLLAREA